MRTFPILNALARRIGAARREHRIARQLDAMSDHDLRDIGIARGEIDLIAAGAVRHGVR